MQTCFLPTTSPVRAHPAIDRLYRTKQKTGRFDHILINEHKFEVARALGWEEWGTLKQLPSMMIHDKTFNDIGLTAPFTSFIQHDGRIEHFSNCVRAACNYGPIKFVGYQSCSNGVPRLSKGTLLPHLKYAGDKDANQELKTIKEFWEDVESSNRFVWVIRIDAVGDTLLTLAAMYTHRKKFPNRQFGLIVRKANVNFWKSVPWVEQVWGIEDGSLEELLQSFPRTSNKHAWVAPIGPGMFKAAISHILNSRRGLKLAGHQDFFSCCTHGNDCGELTERNFLSKLFDIEEIDWPSKSSKTNGGIWFSPYPGGEERLWPPDCWAQALKPIKDQKLFLEYPIASLHKQWSDDFLKAGKQCGLRVERQTPLKGPLDLFQAMAGCKAWIGVNSAPLHVAGLLGLKGFAIGTPYEKNSRWEHPSVTIKANESLGNRLFPIPQLDAIPEFLQFINGYAGWSNCLMLSPEDVSSYLDEWKHH